MVNKNSHSVGVRKSIFAILAFSLPAFTVQCGRETEKNTSQAKTLFVLSEQSTQAWEVKTKAAEGSEIFYGVYRCAAEGYDPKTQQCLFGQSVIVEGVSENDFKNFLLLKLENSEPFQNPESEYQIHLNSFVENKAFSKNEELNTLFTSLSQKEKNSSTILAKLFGPNFIETHPSHQQVLDYKKLAESLVAVENEKNQTQASWNAVSKELQGFLSNIREPKIAERVLIRKESQDSFRELFASFLCVETTLTIPVKLVH